MTIRLSVGGGVGSGKGDTCKFLTQFTGIPVQSAGSYKRARAKALGIRLDELLMRAAVLAPNLDSDTDHWIEQFGLNNPFYIFEGRLAWLSLPQSFKVLLTCDVETRIKRVAQRDHMSLEVARLSVEYRDNYDKENFKLLYDIEDYTDRRHYDWAIDTTNIPAEEVAQLILKRYKEVRAA
jgi:cytidylate kinase